MSESPDINEFEFSLDPVPVPVPAQAKDSPTAANPIADLSYRGYDGPLKNHSLRWWVVALAGIRAARQKKGFWVIVGISVLPFLFILLQLYFQSRVPAGMANGILGNSTNPKYAQSFFQIVDMNLFFLFIMTLMVGTSSISADNRSNALMVYLAKPLTKSDYLIGKFMGIFTTLFTVTFAPAFMLYFYCIMTYWSDGIFKQEPYLIFRVIAACALPAVLHSGLMVGFSAWSKSPRVAGAIYAGFYFISGIFSGIIWGLKTHGRIEEQVLLRHMSVSGLMRGMVQNIYNVTDKQMSFANGSLGMVDISAPSARGVFLISLALCVIGVMAARARIRAVEVVKG